MCTHSIYIPEREKVISRGNGNPGPNDPRVQQGSSGANYLFVFFLFFIFTIDVGDLCSNGGWTGLFGRAASFLRHLPSTRILHGSGHYGAATPVTSLLPIFCTVFWFLDARTGGLAAKKQSSTRRTRPLVLPRE